MRVCGAWTKPWVPSQDDTNQLWWGTPVSLRTQTLAEGSALQTHPQLHSDFEESLNCIRFYYCPPPLFLKSRGSRQYISTHTPYLGSNCFSFSELIGKYRWEIDRMNDTRSHYLFRCDDGILSCVWSTASSIQKFFESRQDGSVGKDTCQSMIMYIWSLGPIRWNEKIIVL